MAGRKSPTDLEMLQAISDRYYDEFASFTRGDETRQTKIHVPIDCEAIAEGLDVDTNIVFGRLYYDMERRYGYSHEDGTKVKFFSLDVEGDRHCVNFPYLDAVLANLQYEDRKYRTATNRSLKKSAQACVFSLQQV